MTDSKIVYDAMNKTRSRKHTHTLIGDMTHACWETIEEANKKGWNFTITKVKAHTDEEDITAGRITKYDRVGNDLADHWAGHGALIDQIPDTTKNIVNTIDATAWTIQKRLITICMNYLEHEKYTPKEPKPRQGSILDTSIEAHGHTIMYTPGTNSKESICGECGQTWTKNTRQEMLHQCPGTIWGTPPQDIEAPWRPYHSKGIIYKGKRLHRTHKLAWIRGIMYCTVCGSYTITKVGSLARQCRMTRSTNGKRVMTDINNGTCPCKHVVWPLPAGTIPTAAIQQVIEQRFGPDRDTLDTNSPTQEATAISAT
jgi:hypothetical protein